MKIVIAAANSFLGRSLARHFNTQGHEVIGLVRRPLSGEPFNLVQWDGIALGDWIRVLEGADALINLAGRTVNCRYDQKNRAEILDSRTTTTSLLGEAVAQCEQPPTVWINSSTATIYRHAEDRPQDEVEGEIGEGFSVEVAKAWEKAFFSARVPGTVRKVAVRTSIVLGREEGTVLQVLLRVARLGLGGTMGSGRQRVSWIHEEDFCRAVEWLIRHPEMDGIVNVGSPAAVSNRGLMTAVRRAAGVPFGVPAARWMLELGALALRTETELILKSRWVIPGRLSNHGFQFRWPGIASAIRDLTSPRGTAGK
jgi:uncharacterized protein (TIGR01777 family)